MKKFMARAFLVLTSCVVFNGCVAVPPLINVQHREAGPETHKKLDEIDRRLQRMEERLDKMDKR